MTIIEEIHNKLGPDFSCYSNFGSRRNYKEWTPILQDRIGCTEDAYSSEPRALEMACGRFVCSSSWPFSVASDVGLGDLVV